MAVLSGTFDWQSFWDLATTTEAAKALFAIYGANAAQAAMESAVAAVEDDRVEDSRFWLEVAEKLRGTRH